MNAPLDNQATLLPLRQMVLRSLTVLLVVAAALTAALGWRVFDTTSSEQRTAAALDAARTRTAQVLSIDAAAQGEDRAGARRHVTGELGAHFEEVADALLPGGSAAPVSTRAVVVRAAVLAAQAERVEALLFVNQVTTAPELPEALTTATQVTVTMTLVDGQWLISELEQV